MCVLYSLQSFSVVCVVLLTVPEAISRNTVVAPRGNGRNAQQVMVTLTQALLMSPHLLSSILSFLFPPFLSSPLITFLILYLLLLTSLVLFFFDFPRFFSFPFFFISLLFYFLFLLIFSPIVISLLLSYHPYICSFNHSFHCTTHSQLLYKPPIHADEIGLTTDKYIALNETVSWLPLQISYAPLSLQVHSSLYYCY